MKNWDLIVVGAGTAGIPSAIAAAEAGGSVLVLDVAHEWGGTLKYSTGWLSGAGTKIQKGYGIQDSPDAHFSDVLRISKGTIDQDLARQAVDQAPAVIDWLMDNDFDLVPGHPIKGDKHESYLVDRYYRGMRDGLSILEVLDAKFRRLVDEGRVTVSMGSEVVGLVSEVEGESDVRVSGVVAQSVDEPNATPATYRSRNVILATGGYNANPAKFAELSGHTLYALGANSNSKGNGIELACSVGGWTRGAENFWSSFGSVLQDRDYPSPVRCDPIHRPELRMPWEIYVNLNGERFIAEDCPSVDRREAALMKQPDMRRFIVFDARILFEAPPLIPGWTSIDIANNAGSHPMFFLGDTVPELATAAGIPAEALVQTVDEYNHALSGEDPFGRVFRPRAIERGPYFAIEVHSTSVTSAVGIAVDHELRVIDKENQPILGLFACGEILGSGQLQGASFTGGMLLTPSIGLGFALGARIS